MAAGSRAGRPPTPTEAKVLDGTFRKDRAGAPGYSPEVGIPAAPKELSKEGRTEWKRVTSLPDAAQLVAHVDLAPLAGYCEALGTWQRAQRVLNKSGLTFKTPQGYIQQRPEVSIARQAMKDAVDYAREFGWSPAARRRVTPPQAKPKTESPWDRFGKK